MSEAPSIRAFIAVEIDEPLRAELDKLQARLQSRIGGSALRWTKPEQIHLTLKFLGDVRAGTIGDLEAALRRACAGLAPFTMALEGLGCFPSPKKPSVVWVGISRGAEQIKELFARVERETRGFSERREDHDFHPHLTIGRVRKASFAELRRIGELIQSAQCGTLGEISVTAVHLMKSEFSPGGAEHTRLAAVAFGSKSASEDRTTTREI